MDGRREKGVREENRQGLGRESEDNEGGWEEGTQELIKRGRKEAVEVDQVQEVMVGTCIMGFVKCEKKKLVL